MAKTIQRLSEARVREATEGLHPDGDGTYLQITRGTDGELNKSWFFRFVSAVTGKERRMGLGSLPKVDLATARERADAARRLHKQGIDPIEDRDAKAMPVKPVVTFRMAFETFYALKRRTLANRKHIEQWRSTMEVYVFPIIGKRPVAKVTPKEIIAVLEPIWFEKPETAKRVLQRMRAVFEAAIVAEDRVTVAPTTGVATVLGTRHRVVEHHRALPFAEVPEFLIRLRCTSSWPATKLCFAFLILTAARSGEVRLACWREIDEQFGLWRVPRERMKARRAHVVPLSDQCLEILATLKAVYPHGPDDPLFPSLRPGKPLSDMVLTKLLRDMGLGDRATAHGFRSSFKVWATKVAKVLDDISEEALAHTIPEKVRKSYLRSATSDEEGALFLDERRTLMAAWGRFCSEPVPTDKVVPLRSAVSA